MATVLLNLKSSREVLLALAALVAGSFTAFKLAAPHGLVFVFLVGLFSLALVALHARTSKLMTERTSLGCELQRFQDVLKEHFFFLEVDASGRFVDANARYLDKIGLSLEQLKTMPRGALAGGQNGKQLDDMWSQVCDGRTFSGEFTDTTADGSTLSVRAIVIPRLDQSGRLQSVWTLGVDVTEQRNAEREARDAAAKLEAFVAHAPAAVAMFDTDMRYIAHTERWLEDYRLPRASLVGRSHYDVFPEVPDHWRAKHQRILTGCTERADEERFQREDGSQHIVRWEVRPWYLQDRSIGGMMMLTEDITQSKRLKDDLWRLAHIDTTTGLPNRRHFNTCLREAIADASGRNGRFALAFIDIDRFKLINDTLGHDVGDSLLSEVASRLRGCAELGGIAARLGGDEFAIIVDDCNPEAGKERVFEELVQAMRQPMELGGVSRSCSLSIGVAMFPDDADDASELLKCADLAVYQAKEMGRDQIAYYSTNLRQSVQRKEETIEDARQGLARDEFVMFYQPVIPVDPAQPPSFEALLRWNHPTRGLLAPGAFEEVFENDKLAFALGERVRELTLNQIKQWQDMNFWFNRVAINVISPDFSQDLAQRLFDQLAALEIEPSRICIEVTERVFLGAGVSHVGDALRKMHASGIEIALDDFGTGYASLSHIKAYPIDRLKIDRSFVSNIEVNSDNLSIVQAIVQLGSSLGLSTTAEGVETREQVALLQALGCGSLQGYFYSKPVPAEKLTGHRLLSKASA